LIYFYSCFHSIQNCSLSSKRSVWSALTSQIENWLNSLGPPTTEKSSSFISILGSIFFKTSNCWQFRWRQVKIFNLVIVFSSNNLLKLMPVRLTSTSSKVSFSWFTIYANELLPTSVCLKSSTFILEHLTTNVPICWSLRHCKLRKLSFWIFVVKLLTK